MSIAGASVFGPGVNHGSHTILIQSWAQINAITNKNTFIITMKLFLIDLMIFYCINQLLAIFIKTLTWNGL